MSRKILLVNAVRYRAHYYRTASGKEPAADFIESLNKKKRATLMAAIREILCEQGIDVCASEWGKNLGKGLCEFRVREKGVLLRVLFHAHGDKMVLLLSGYDKGRKPSKKKQDAEIDRARKYLADYKRNN